MKDPFYVDGFIDAFLDLGMKQPSYPQEDPNAFVFYRTGFLEGTHAITDLRKANLTGQEAQRRFEGWVREFKYWNGKITMVGIKWSLDAALQAFIQKYPFDKLFNQGTYPY